MGACSPSGDVAETIAVHANLAPLPPGIDPTRWTCRREAPADQELPRTRPRIRARYGLEPARLIPGQPMIAIDELDKIGDDADVGVELKDELSPSLLRRDGDDEYLYVIMPMRL